MIRVGDWVTQYSAGYWQVLDIIPKYADSDYNSDVKSWKKGDLIGNWAILKKGFTPKMKPSNRCEFTDFAYCKKVSPDILRTIESAFLDNPKALEKFNTASSWPDPAVASVWLTMSDEEADRLSVFLETLPKRFTSKEFWEAAEAFRCFVTKPPATHILHFFAFPWELNEDFDCLHFDPLLKKLDTQ